MLGIAILYVSRGSRVDLQLYIIFYKKRLFYEMIWEKRDTLGIHSPLILNSLSDSKNVIISTTTTND